MTKYLSTEEVCELLEIKTYGRVRNWLHTGNFPGSHYCTTTYRWWFEREAVLRVKERLNKIRTANEELQRFREAGEVVDLYVLTPNEITEEEADQLWEDIQKPSPPRREEGPVLQAQKPLDKLLEESSSRQGAEESMDTKDQERVQREALMHAAKDVPQPKPHPLLRQDSVQVWRSPSEPKTSRRDTNNAASNLGVRDVLQPIEEQGRIYFEEKRRERIDSYARMPRKEELLKPLTPEEYERAPVPSKDEIRAAVKRGNEILREAAQSPKIKLATNLPKGKELTQEDWDRLQKEAREWAADVNKQAQQIQKLEEKVTSLAKFCGVVVE